VTTIPKGFSKEAQEASIARVQAEKAAIIAKSTRSHRKSVWQKTNGRCFYCGVPFRRDKPVAGDRDWLLPQKTSVMGIDHDVPKNRQGLNELSNLRPCCSQCNSKKGLSTTNEYRLRCGLRARQWPFRFFGDRQGIERDFIVVASENFFGTLIARNFGGQPNQQYKAPRR
jgi:5-methylcytosine-specific restriction endonuclease McrA